MYSDTKKSSAISSADCCHCPRYQLEEGCKCRCHEGKTYSEESDGDGGLIGNM